MSDKDYVDDPPSKLSGKRKPAAGRRLSPLTTPGKSKLVKVGSHRDLLAMARKLASRLSDDPEFSVMLLINPVLALKQYGIELSPEMQRHVLRTLRHPPKLRLRRESLEAALNEALGEEPKPNDPAWMARLVFVLRKLPPLDLTDAAPTFRPPYNARMIERLQKQRPAATRRYPGKRRIGVQTSVGVAAWTPAVRRLDLDAPAPELPLAQRQPKTLELEQAWYYKDRDPVVRDAVELGEIERRGFPFYSPAGFRDVAAGKRVDAFRAFVKSVRLPGSGS